MGYLFDQRKLKYSQFILQLPILLIVILWRHLSYLGVVTERHYVLVLTKYTQSAPMRIKLIKLMKLIHLKDTWHVTSPKIYVKNLQPIIYTFQSNPN
jgi:hypothetical protein